MKKILVFTATIGIILMLMTINSKLLIHLNWIKSGYFILDYILISVAGLAFALGTVSVVIFYNPERKEEQSKTSYFFTKVSSSLLKLTFAVLDGLHVYIYNNEHITDLATYISPIFAIQTTLILFFIGNSVHQIISEKPTSTNEILKQETELKSNLLHEQSYHKMQKSRILKKKPENRTEKEIKLLTEAENYLQTNKILEQ